MPVSTVRFPSQHMSGNPAAIAWPGLQDENGETAIAPIQPIDQTVTKLPVCLYELGQLQYGLPVFSCPRCGLFYNSTDLVLPQCTHCGLKPRELTMAELADIIIPPKVVDAVLDAARQQKAERLGEVPRILGPGEEFAGGNRADEATIAARKAARPPKAGRPPVVAQPPAPME